MTHLVHITEDMARLSGGVPAVVRQLANKFSYHQGFETSVIHAKGDASDIAGLANVITCKPAGALKKWSYSPRLPTVIRNCCVDDSLFHIHGLWTAPPTLAALISTKLKRPTLFTSHGMLVPWLWNNQGSLIRLKKTLFWNLLGKRSLRKCTLIHAITPLERDELAFLLPDCQIEVIPNAIDIDCPVPNQAQRRQNILFLGRIEPKKGVDILIKAFACASLSYNWQLIIAGPSWSDNFLNYLKNLVNASGLAERIVFTGAVFGAEKNCLLDESWVMVAPSHSEVIGLVNLEAAAHALPSITTLETGLWDWEEGGGCLVQPEIALLAKALKKASSWSDSERHHRGLASRKLVEEKYSWKAVMPQWLQLYSHLQSKS